VQHPEGLVSRIGRGKIVDNAAEVGNPRREQEMFRRDDSQQGDAQSQHAFPRSFSEQKQQEQPRADRELDALPVEKDPIILFSRIPAQYGAFPRSPYGVELCRCSGIARRFQKAVDGLKILRYGNIGKNTRAEPRAHQKS